MDPEARVPVARPLIALEDQEGLGGARSALIMRWNPDALWWATGIFPWPSGQPLTAHPWWGAEGWAGDPQWGAAWGLTEAGAVPRCGEWGVAVAGVAPVVVSMEIDKHHASVKSFQTKCKTIMLSCRHLPVNTCLRLQRSVSCRDLDLLEYLQLIAPAMIPTEMADTSLVNNEKSHLIVCWSNAILSCH